MLNTCFQIFYSKGIFPKTYNVMITSVHNKSKIEINFHGICIMDHPKDSRIPGP